MRLSLAVTLAIDPKARIIKSEATKWCIDFVRYYDLLFVEACRDKVFVQLLSQKLNKFYRLLDQEMEMEYQNEKLTVMNYLEV